MWLFGLVYWEAAACCLSVSADLTAHKDPLHTDYIGPSSGIRSLNAPPESCMLSQILYVCVWGLWVCVWLTISKRQRQKTQQACNVYWPGQSFTKQRVEGNKKGRMRQMGGKKCRDECRRNGMSVLRPTGLELGSWQGSHYMRVSDSSLSLG